MVPSEYVPVAVNCSVVPLAMLGLAGVTAIESRAAGLTVRTVEPLTPPSVALIVDVPVATPVASPLALIVATEVVAEAQVTWPVRSCVVLSEYVPVAVNCCGQPLATLGLAGVTAIDCRAAAADRQHRRAGDAAERGADRGGARRHAGGQARRR